MQPQTVFPTVSNSWEEQQRKREQASMLRVSQVQQEHQYCLESRRNLTQSTSLSGWMNPASSSPSGTHSSGVFAFPTVSASDPLIPRPSEDAPLGFASSNAPLAPSMSSQGSSSFPELPQAPQAPQAPQTPTSSPFPSSQPLTAPPQPPTNDEDLGDEEDEELNDAVDSLQSSIKETRTDDPMVTTVNQAIERFKKLQQDKKRLVREVGYEAEDSAKKVLEYNEELEKLKHYIECYFQAIASSQSMGSIIW